MRGLDAYKTQTPNWTRIDMLLAAYDGVLSRLRQVKEILARGGGDAEIQPLLIRSQRIVTELYSGLDLQYGDIPKNIQKLYIYVLSVIGLGPTLEIDSAIQVLDTIRQALSSIRDEAADLESRGLCHPVDHDKRVLQYVTA